MRESANDYVIITPKSEEEGGEDSAVSIKGISVASSNRFYADLYYGFDRIVLSPKDNDSLHKSAKSYLLQKQQEKQNTAKEQLEQELKKNVV